MKTLIRWIALPVGLLIFVIGAITFPLPIPTGIILMIVGLSIAALNPMVLRWLKATRKKFPEASLRIQRIAPYMPKFVRRIIRKTDSR
ncbi:MAG: hypothetical protein AB3N28_12155 [Kordiimonas sp.]